MEYLVTMTTRVPDGVPEREVDAVRAREAERTRELARSASVLRLWRPPLGPGEADPGAVAVPPGTDAHRVDAVTAREARRAAQLATGGELLRLWRLPGENRALGLWQAENAERMREIAASLPLAPWLDTTTLALTRHPNDPVPG